MGGKALSKPSVRLNKDEYFKLVDEIIPKIRSAIDGDVNVIPTYESKETFGDMDVLVNTSDAQYKQKIYEAIGAVESTSNGSCISYGVMINDCLFQIDIIYSSIEDYDFAYRYYSWSDCGNLIGRIAHKLKFKFGHDGLWYILRSNNDDTRVIKEIPVTKDYNLALKFIGYEPRGDFKDLNELFEYAVSSKYANKDIYLLENRNSQARRRDRKRKTYHEFLEWLETPTVEVPKFDWTEKEALRLEFLGEAFKLFPQFKVDYDHAVLRNELRIESKSKYSGDLVSEWTGYSGRDLGLFMESYKKSVNLAGDGFIDYINRMSVDQVKEQVLQFKLLKETNGL